MWGGCNLLWLPQYAGRFDARQRPARGNSLPQLIDDRNLVAGSLHVQTMHRASARPPTMWFGCNFLAAAVRLVVLMLESSCEKLQNSI